MLIVVYCLVLLHANPAVSADLAAANSNSTPSYQGTLSVGSNTNFSHHTVIQRDGPGYHKIFKEYVLPIIFGLKITAVLVAIFTALKLWVIQSLMVSKASLVGATILAAKAAYDHIQQKIKAAKLSSYDTNGYHQQGWPHFPWSQWPDWLQYYSHLYQPADHSFQSAEQSYQPADQYHHQSAEHSYQPYDHIHALSTQRDRVAIPHFHPAHNNTFHIRSDAVNPTTNPLPPTVIAFKDIVTKITETTYK